MTGTISSKALKFLGGGGVFAIAVADSAAVRASSAAFSSAVGGETLINGIGALDEKPLKSLNPNCACNAALLFSGGLLNASNPPPLNPAA